MQENRYDRGPAYLAGSAGQRVEPGVLQQVGLSGHGSPPDTPVTVLANAIPNYEGASERTTAKDRALATTIRMVLWVVTLLLVGWGLVELGVDLILVALGVAVLLLLGYWWLTRLDYKYSGPGVARYAIDAAERLAAQQLANQQELRRRALESYIQYLERKDAGPGT